MEAIAVVKKHMFANRTKGMLHSVLIFSSTEEAVAWANAHPVDEYTRVGNGYQYEWYTPRLVGEA